jgi:hypothetical protein
MARQDVDLRNDARSNPGSLYQVPEIRRRVESKTFLASSEFWVLVGAVVALFVGAFEALSAVRGDRTG